MKEDSICQRIRGVACLSTPFLVTRRRNNIFWQVESVAQKNVLRDALYAATFSMLLAAILATYALLARPWQKFDIGRYPKETIEVLLAVYAAGLVAHLISGKARGAVTQWSLERIAGFVRSTVTIEKALDLTALSSKRIFIARSIADEASSFIGSAQLVAWLATRVWLEMERLGSRAAGGLVKNAFPHFVYKHFPRTLFGTVRLFLGSAGLALGLFIGGVALLGFGLGGALVGRLLTLFLAYIGCNFVSSALIFSTLVSAHIVLYLLAPLVWAFLTLLSILPFGWELAVRNLLLGISAESTPEGCWQVELIAPTTPTQGVEVPLSHSEIYDSEIGQAKLIAWIRDRCSEIHDVRSDAAFGKPT
jgi:hypothetical protein